MAWSDGLVIPLTRCPVVLFGCSSPPNACSNGSIALPNSPSSSPLPPRRKKFKLTLAVRVLRDSALMQVMAASGDVDAKLRVLRARRLKVAEDALEYATPAYAQAIVQRATQKHNECEAAARRAEKRNQALRDKVKRLADAQDAHNTNETARDDVAAAAALHAARAEYVATVRALYPQWLAHVAQGQQQKAQQKEVDRAAERARYHAAQTAFERAKAGAAAAAATTTRRPADLAPAAAGTAAAGARLSPKVPVAQTRAAAAAVAVQGGESDSDSDDVEEDEEELARQRAAWNDELRRRKGELEQERKAASAEASTTASTSSPATADALARLSPDALARLLETVLAAAPPDAAPWVDPAPVVPPAFVEAVASPAKAAETVRSSASAWAAATCALVAAARNNAAEPLLPVEAVRFVAAGRAAPEPSELEEVLEAAHSPAAAKMWRALVVHFLGGGTSAANVLTNLLLPESSTALSKLTDAQAKSAHGRLCDVLTTMLGGSSRPEASSTTELSAGSSPLHMGATSLMGAFAPRPRAKPSTPPPASELPTSSAADMDAPSLMGMFAPRPRSKPKPTASVEPSSSSSSAAVTSSQPSSTSPSSSRPPSAVPRPRLSSGVARLVSGRGFGLDASFDDDSIDDEAPVPTTSASTAAARTASTAAARTASAAARRSADSSDEFDF